MTERRELIEICEASPKLVLVEDARRSGRIIVRGEFGRAGVPTANKRIYPRRLWEREFDRLRDAVANRTVTGELNHPKDGRADMFNTSHIITGLTLTPDGLVIGEAEVMEELPGGKVVAAIYRRGGKVGVSSRGFGSTQLSPEGHEVVQEDYQLVTFDFVADPADQFAYPELVTETSASRRYSFPALGESTMPSTDQTTAASIRAEMATRMTEAVAEVRKTATARAIKLIAEDPASLPKEVQESLRAFFGGSSVVLQEQTEQMKKLEAERDAAIQMAKTAGFNLYVERVCANDPDGAVIREGVGDVALYENAAALKEKISAIQTEAQQRRAIEEETRRAVEAQQAHLAEERQTMELRMAKLEEALNKSLALNKALTVDNYQTEALSFAPPSVRRAVNAASPRTVDEVDELMEGLRPPRQTPDQTGAARARARAWASGAPRTRTSTPLDEERSTARNALTEDYYGLGASLAELRSLSGIGQG